MYEAKHFASAPVSIAWFATEQVGSAMLAGRFGLPVPPS